MISQASTLFSEHGNVISLKSTYISKNANTPV